MAGRTFDRSVSCQGPTTQWQATGRIFSNGFRGDCRPFVNSHKEVDLRRSARRRLRAPVAVTPLSLSGGDFSIPVRLGCMYEPTKPPLAGSKPTRHRTKRDGERVEGARTSDAGCRRATQRPPAVPEQQPLAPSHPSLRASNSIVRVPPNVWVLYRAGKNYITL